MKETNEILLDNDLSRALSRMNVTAGEAAIPYLIHELKNERWMQRWTAAKLLGEIGTSAETTRHTFLPE